MDDQNITLTELKYRWTKPLLDEIERLQAEVEELTEKAFTHSSAAMENLKEVEQMKAQVPRWIPVTERLPEKSGQYLTINEHGWFTAYPYSIIHKQWNTQDWMSEKSAKGVGINSITHWMPLPQAPEVEG